MVALITPFNEDGSVNYKRLRELIDWHVDQQTDAILVLGTTAETPTLTVSEEDEIARISIEQAKGRVPIIVGSGSNNTMVAIEQSLKYEKMGADGLLVITPYYNKASKAGMVNHFMQVADAVHTPIMFITYRAERAYPLLTKHWRRSASTRTSWGSKKPAATCP